MLHQDDANRQNNSESEKTQFCEETTVIRLTLYNWHQHELDWIQSERAAVLSGFGKEVKTKSMFYATAFNTHS